MHRQLSNRSNDGFLFHHDAESASSNLSPFGNGNQQDGDLGRRGSREKAMGLALESPWKSPGWKLQQRERSGSVVMTSVEEENEVPKVRFRIPVDMQIADDGNSYPSASASST
jgi:hypothetical protein